MTLANGSDALWYCYQVDEYDLLFWNALIEQDLYSGERSPPSGQHRIKKQNVALSNIMGKRRIIQTRELCHFISLDQYLADTN